MEDIVLFLLSFLHSQHSCTTFSCADEMITNVISATLTPPIYTHNVHIFLLPGKSQLRFVNSQALFPW